jgi:hypothetical protein
LGTIDEDALREGWPSPSSVSSPQASLDSLATLVELLLSGMARVLRARDPELGRELAVKVLRSGCGRPGSTGEWAWPQRIEATWTSANS